MYEKVANVLQKAQRAVPKDRFKREEEVWLPGSQI